MIITKETIVNIKMSGGDLLKFKTLLESIIAANTTANEGQGFLKTKEEKYIENLLNELSNDKTNSKI